MFPEQINTSKGSIAQDGSCSTVNLLIIFHPNYIKNVTIGY